MNSAAERYHQRARALRGVTGAPHLVLLPGAAAAKELADQAVDPHEDAGEVGMVFGGAPSIDEATVQSTLEEAGAAWDQRRWELLLDGMWSSVLRSLAGPFGLGHLLAGFDQRGGAVDTTHNVRQDVYATEAERRRYDERVPTASSTVYQHEAYKDAGAALKQRVLDGTATDTYTGMPIKRTHLHDRQLGSSTDHAVAHTKVDACRARVLSGLRTEDVANDPANLVSTTRSVNSFLNDRSAEQSARLLRDDAPARRARLEELEARREHWTDQERKQYNSLKAKDNIDPATLKEKEAQAQAAINRRVDLAYYTSGKFWRATARAGAAQGVALGAQQALGVVLVEFFAGAIDEARSLYREGVNPKSLPKQLGARMRCVATRVAAKRDAVLAAFGQGFVAGLLSSLITTLINAFATTARRAARMLREGALSLLRAVKLLALCSESMTPQQALHEASKVLVGAGVLVGGIALEEIVSTQLALVPGLGVFAGAAAAALVGALTAVLTSFAVYLVDKADVFKVNAEARSAAVKAALDDRLDQSVLGAREALARLTQAAGAL